MSTSFKSSGHSGDESHHYYRQGTSPTASDPLQVGDLWSDTTSNVLKRCTSVSPVTFVSVEGGSSAHDLFSATHGDVDDADTPADDDVLTYDSVSGKWRAEAGAGHAHSQLHDEDHAARHADGGADELAIQDIATDAATDGQIFTADGSGGVTTQDNEAGINFVIDGGGAVIATGVKGYIEVPFACTITAARLLADQTGSIQVDIWKDTYANYPPVDADSITASAVPAISSSNKDEDTTLTGWTTGISKGDILGFNVDSVATIERVTLSLSVKKS